MAKRLLNEQQLLAELPWLTSNRLRYFREKRKIPWHAVGHRTLLYDPEAIVKAMEQFKVRAFSNL
jgi:hypothetical protein